MGTICLEVQTSVLGAGRAPGHRRRVAARRSRPRSNPGIVVVNPSRHLAAPLCRRSGWIGADRDVAIQEGVSRVFVGGERFLAQQLEDGSWSVLDRRYHETVGSVAESHEQCERRATAPNAANARLQAQGRRLEREERDRVDAAAQV